MIIVDFDGSVDEFSRLRTDCCGIEFPLSEDVPLLRMEDYQLLDARFPAIDCFKPFTPRSIIATTLRSSVCHPRRRSAAGIRRLSLCPEAYESLPED
jgi:hypothetical protein